MKFFYKNIGCFFLVVSGALFMMGGQAVEPSWNLQKDIEAVAVLSSACTEEMIMSEGNVTQTKESCRFESESYEVVSREEKENRKQKKILERIVEAEAGDQDLRGRRLVANVILNRVKADEFPDSIREVVFAKRQFSPIANGSYERVTVSKKTKQAVEQALSGVDDSEGALYFMWREGSSPSNVSWFDEDLTRLYSHGCHEFFK